MTHATIDRLAAGIVAAALLGAAAAPAAAQGYPSRPIRYIVPSSPGSGNDFIARLMAADMSAGLGQQIIVDNRAGAGGSIAGELAAAAQPDGYTMFQVSSTIAINQTLDPRLRFDLLRDFAPVTFLAIQPNLVVVHAALPVHSIDDLLRLAKAKPGQLNYSSSGPGSNSFLAAELLNTLAGTRMTHVPYKGGGPAVAAAASGEASLMIGPIATSMPLIQQGRLRGLAVTSLKRLPEFPQIPAVSETVPGYEFNNWYGLSVRAKTPKDVIAVLHRSAVETLNKPSIKKQLAGAGYIVSTGEPAEYGAFLKEQIEKLGKIVRQTGAKPN